VHSGKHPLEQDEIQELVSNVDRKAIQMGFPPEGGS
jgi:hypothetical protein